MDTSQMLKGVIDVAVLAVVADEDGYGYDVVRRLRARGLADVADASVYGTLRRLYAAGALTSYVVPSEEGPHRRYYGVSDLGRELLGSGAAAGAVSCRRSTACWPRTRRCSDDDDRPHPGRRGVPRAGARRARGPSARRARRVARGHREPPRRGRRRGRASPLAVRLGSAEEFAQELRHSAGLPPRVRRRLARRGSTRARARRSSCAGRGRCGAPQRPRSLWQRRARLAARRRGRRRDRAARRHSAAWSHAHAWLPHPGLRGSGAVLGAGRDRRALDLARAARGRRARSRRSTARPARSPWSRSCRPPGTSTARRATSLTTRSRRCAARPSPGLAFNGVRGQEHLPVHARREAAQRRARSICRTAIR